MNLKQWQTILSRLYPVILPPALYCASVVPRQVGSAGRQTHVRRRRHVTGHFPDEIVGSSLQILCSLSSLCNIHISAFGIWLKTNTFPYFMFFCDEWKIHICLIWEIKEWPLLLRASVVTACRQNLQAQRTDDVENGRAGLETSACFIGAYSWACVYLPNKWLGGSALAQPSCAGISW